MVQLLMELPDLDKRDLAIAWIPFQDELIAAMDECEQ